MSIHVHLERFEGPLGLLLHLIREQEMDIFNINIHHITRQYLEYIKSMRRLDLEVAGEFVAMAATLLHIKSKMLLPQYNEEGEAIQEDPRKELVQKLLEYKKIKELSTELYKLPILGRDVFARGEVEDVESLEESELVLEENPLFSLIASYRTAVKNMKKTVHRVGTELQSIASRIMEISHLFEVGKRVLFGDLITETDKRANQVLITFLSLLELAKMGFISVFQNEPFADIHVEPKKPIDTAVVSQVEGYDGVNAAIKADELMVEAQLSLTEVEPMLEGEDAPVVQETFADAATDADIEAEEARLFAGDDVVVAPSLEPTVESLPVATDMVADESMPIEAIAAEGPTELAVEEVFGEQITPAPELQPIVEQPFYFQAIQEMPAIIEEPAPEVVVEDVPTDIALSAISEELQIELVMPEEPPVPVVDQNVNSAVSAAMNAFAAFDEVSSEKPIEQPSVEQPESPVEDNGDTRPPEVES